MNAFSLYEMDRAAFKEVSDKVAKRLAEHVKATFDYYLEHMPGLTGLSGRERLAFYRSTDQAYWDTLANVNLYEAVNRMKDWQALNRRYPRLVPVMSNGAYPA